MSFRDELRGLWEKELALAQAELSRLDDEHGSRQLTVFGWRRADELTPDEQRLGDLMRQRVASLPPIKQAETALRITSLVLADDQVYARLKNRAARLDRLLAARCAYCGDWFPPVSLRQRYCSKSHGRIARRKRWR